jgi:thymidylate synthase (FAD)
MTHKSNHVELIGWYGGDDRHCLSAWQSTNLELGVELDSTDSLAYKKIYEETVKTKKKSPGELLKFLAEHNHTSPFRKSYLDFQVTADVACHLQSAKHRIGVEINSSSLRYKEHTNQWHLPEDWYDQIVNTKALREAGLDEYVIDLGEFDDQIAWSDVLNEFNRRAHKLYHMAAEQLTPELGRARAKESARYFLPYSKQLDFDMQFSFQAFINFQNLRNSPHAQKEIREIAATMLDLVQNIPGNPFKYSLEAFGYGKGL